LDLVNLSALMERTRGKPEVKVGLVDGPVARNHPDLPDDHIRNIPGSPAGRCALPDSSACEHGTFVAGILCAKRNSPAPAICPDCTLLVRPIFAEKGPRNGQPPIATPVELAAAITECVQAGVRVINLSLALAQSPAKGQRELRDALDFATQREVLVVAAAGNQGTIGSSEITRHPWVIPVVACDLRGQPIGQSNLASSFGRRGLSAPGDRITSLGANGTPLTSGGTSVAAPFVTGAIALLWSEYPAATAAKIKSAVTQTQGRSRTTLVPALLDAWKAYQTMSKTNL